MRGRPGRPARTVNRESRSYRAAQLCAEHGVTERDAAERFGISCVSVHLAKIRHFKGVRGPLRPFPEDELSW